MKTPPNQTASESASSKANSILCSGVDATRKPKPSHENDQVALDLNSERNIAMENLTPTQQVAASALADLQALRLPANYGATLGVKKLLTAVPVGKPKKGQFFRTHAADEMTFGAMFLEQKEARESYVVLPNVAQAISELV